MRSLPSGTSVCSLSMAVNERYKDSRSGEWGDRPNYFDVTIWGGIGEWVGRELHKGDGIVVNGRLRWRSWEKDGQKRSAVDVTADSIVPMPRDGGGSRSSANGGGQQQSAAAAPAGDSAWGGQPLPGADDDIPF